VAHGHRQRRVGARLRRQPVVGELDVVGVVRRDDDHLLTAVARLGHEVRVRRARDRKVRSPDDQVARVPPVRRLRYVGLVAEHLRRGRRQIRVPVIERGRVAADQRQEARARSERHWRHRRDRREAADAVGPVLANRVNGRRRDQLARLVPVAAHEAAAATLASVGAVRCHLGERRDRVRRGGLRGAPTVEQAAANVRVLQPDRRVGVPGKRRAARAAARLMIGSIRIGTRIIDRLRLPGDQPVLDVDVPRARTGAIHSVRRSHDLVVAPAIAVGRFPPTALGDQHAPPFRVGLAPAEELVRGRQPRIPAHSRSPGHNSVRALADVIAPPLA
jgi:hypothetical protein